MIKYEWADVSAVKGIKKTEETAQIAGETVRDVVERAEAAGADARVLLRDEARSPNHFFHKAFTWDNKEAADKWRLEEAAKIIQAIRVVDVQTGTAERAFVHVGVVEETSPRYVSRERVMSDATLRDTARAALLAWVAGGLRSWRSLLLATDEGKTLVAAAERFLAVADKKLDKTDGRAV